MSITALSVGIQFEETNANNFTLEEIAGKKLNTLMIFIAEAIHDKKKDELIKYLNELSDIVTIRAHETIEAYNSRVRSILTISRENDLRGTWNRMITINGVLRNTKGKFIESLDTHTQPSIDLILGLPISQSSKERELMLLKIYGISIEEMNRVLNEG